MNENPWLLFLYRVFQIATVGALGGLLLVGAVAGFILAPMGHETAGAGFGALLTGVAWAIVAWRENVSGRPSNRLSS